MSDRKKLVIKPTSKFQKDLKRAGKRGCDIELLTEVIKTLAADEMLDGKYLDHPLKGDYKEYRECHITSDWLLIYEIGDGSLYLIRTGTHGDLY